MSGEPSHFEIGVPDVERAQRFFGELLGWKFEEADHGAHIDTQATAGGLHPEPAPSMQVFFKVSDLDAAARRVIELGGEVDEGRSEGPGGRYLHSCRDDQGTPFGLHETQG